MINRQRLLERFLRYVRVDTTAGEDAAGQSSAGYPSSPGQLELGKMLVEELQALGLADARQDSFGIVTATVPPSPGDESAPVVAFCAHLDTSPETSGAGVQPQVIEDYAGGDLVLSADPQRVIRVADCPELEQVRGKTLITTDGTTLLGADDKAGVAVIVETAAWLIEHPESRRAPVRICFTCDEEIGHGTDHVDLDELGATVCYTLDGQGADTIDVETFSADLAVVTVRGVEIHPSIAKDRMVNAVRVTAAFLDRLPRDTLAPESTEERQGFLHPYRISGGVGETTVRVLLRDFDTAALADHAQVLRRAASVTMEDFPGSQIDVEVRPQYRNMAEGLHREPRAVPFAEQALESLGRSARKTIVRGGTDGSRFTELGLPTPNLATGQHTPHSPLEWACLEEMVSSTEWLVALAGRWCDSPD